MAAQNFATTTPTRNVVDVTIGDATTNFIVPPRWAKRVLIIASGAAVNYRRVSDVGAATGGIVPVPAGGSFDLALPEVAYPVGSAVPYSRYFWLSATCVCVFE